MTAGRLSLRGNMIPQQTTARTGPKPAFQGAAGCVLIYVTVPALAEAGKADKAPDETKIGEKIIKRLLEKRLIACGNLLPGALSFFRWEGKTQSAAESLLIMKTVRPRVPAAMEEIKKMHPYECPCILALPLEDGFPPFLKWIEESCLT